MSIDTTHQKRLLVANNDNLKPILEDILGKEVYAKIAAFKALGSLCEPVTFSVGDVEVQILRGEDSANEILKYMNPFACGVTGSDLALAKILSGDLGEGVPKQYFNSMQIGGNSYGLWKKSKEGLAYADLVQLFPEGTLKEGVDLKFESSDRIVEMKVLSNFKDIVPALSIVGRKESGFGEIVADRNSQGNPVKVVCESRYLPLADNILKAERERLSFSYTIKQVQGSTEGYVLRHGQIDAPWKCDISIDVVRTGGTADSNTLRVYKPLMQTAPVELHCREIGRKERVTLRDLVSVTV